MSSVAREAVPEVAAQDLSRRVRPERWGGYADCFAVTIDRTVTLPEFVYAFYTSPAFRAERLLLRVFIGAASRPSDADAVARGSATQFAAWYVGERTATQLLMCDRYEGRDPGFVWRGSPATVRGCSSARLWPRAAVGAVLSLGAKDFASCCDFTC